jgi:hypothetical protein
LGVPPRKKKGDPKIILKKWKIDYNKGPAKTAVETEFLRNNGVGWRSLPRDSAQATLFDSMPLAEYSGGHAN